MNDESKQIQEDARSYDGNNKFDKGAQDRVNYLDKKMGEKLDTIRSFDK